MNLNERGHWTDRVEWPATPAAPTGLPVVDPVADWLADAPTEAPTLDELSAAIERGHTQREAA